MPFVVGLTGGIGSGKSAATAEFARLGAAVVDADDISRELTGPNGAAIPAVRKLLGDEFIDARGAMDRARVRDFIFSDPSWRERLEALLHPMVRAETLQRIATASTPYVLLVVPLLIESGNPRQRVNRVLVIDCPEALQLARVRVRSGLSEDMVRRIMATQVEREVRRAAADDIIDNSGNLEALHNQVRRLHAYYLTLAGKPPAPPGRGGR